MASADVSSPAPRPTYPPPPPPTPLSALRALPVPAAPRRSALKPSRPRSRPAQPRPRHAVPARPAAPIAASISRVTRHQHSKRGQPRTRTESGGRQGWQGAALSTGCRPAFLIQASRGPGRQRVGSADWSRRSFHSPTPVNAGTAAASGRGGAAPRHPFPRNRPDSRSSRQTFRAGCPGDIGRVSARWRDPPDPASRRAIG